MRWAPVTCFVVAVVSLLGAFNEAHLHHFGATVVLLMLTGALIGGGLLSLRGSGRIDE